MTPFDTLRASLDSPLAGVNFMAEWDYRYTERIGMLCPPLFKNTDGSWIIPEPSATEKRLAREEADAAIRDFRNQLKPLETFEAL